MAKSQAKTKAVHAKTRPVAFKVTPEQYEMIEERARQRGMLVGPWMRAVVLQAANAPSNGRFIRIYEPNGATS
jgi:hypothetical protein